MHGERSPGASDEWTRTMKTPLSRVRRGAGRVGVPGSDVFSRGRRCLRPPQEDCGRRAELCRAISFVSDSLVVVATCVGAKPNHAFFSCQHPATTFFRLQVGRLWPALNACDAGDTPAQQGHAPANVFGRAKRACFMRSSWILRGCRSIRTRPGKMRAARRCAHRKAHHCRFQGFSHVGILWPCTRPNAPKCANFSSPRPGWRARHLATKAMIRTPDQVSRMR